MPIVGKLLKKGLQLRSAVEQEYGQPYDLQKEQLEQLLITAENTGFGQHYRFGQVLQAYHSADPDAFYREFCQKIPIHDYNKMHNEWWYLCREGMKNVSWPGRIRYFALSSGTSEAASKYIPVTSDMLRAMQKVSVRQILSLNQYDLPEKLFQKGILMLGGSTDLNRYKYSYEGDLSGITCKQMPYWFYSFYKPGHKISKEKDWARKLDEITREAHKWDIGVIVGVPAWLQMLLEKIIDHYGLHTIHDIWPNLSIFTHGGVSITPYLKSFERLTDRPLTYIETYLASEGFIAFQRKPHSKAMQMMLNCGIFFEFIPFNERNFTAEGELVEYPETLMIHEVEEGKEYALLLSSCAGAWRYLIGDVVKFTHKKDSEIVITGRTRHFLSLCGEHLSVDNMNRAVQMLSEELNAEINEYTVVGIAHDNLFAHHWFLSVNKAVDEETVRLKLDENLKLLNDDYRTERRAALKEIKVSLLPAEAFLEWMKSRGKVGGQHKFPRVIKGQHMASWLSHVQQFLPA
jgi:hypothetical protein